MTARTRVLIFVGGVVLLIVGLTARPRGGPEVAAQSRPESAVSTRPRVRVARLEAHSANRTVRLTGTLRSGSEAVLSAKLGGRVLGVFCREGDTVSRGQTLVRFDIRDARAQADQAHAATRAAGAALSKARTGRTLKELDAERRIRAAKQGLEQARLALQKAEAGARVQTGASDADVARAQAGLDATRSDLARLNAGAPAADRRQAALGVTEAERAVETATRNLADIELLFRSGGAPRIQRDEARDAQQRARDALSKARAGRDRVESGPTPEAVAAAEAQIRAAEAGVAAATAAAGRRELDAVDIAAARAQVRAATTALGDAIAARTEVELSRSDVRAAEAALEQARAGSQLAERQVGEAAMVSPVEGVVRAVRIHAGELAGPGQPLLEIVGANGVYLEAACPSRLLADLRGGLGVRIYPEVQPGLALAGVVRSISSVAGPDGRSYPVRIDLASDPAATSAAPLRPGGFARAEISVERRERPVTAPLEALQVTDGRASLWVVEGDRVRSVPVDSRVGASGRAIVVGPVLAGQTVILAPPPGLRDGDSVVVVSR